MRKSRSLSPDSVTTVVSFSCRCGNVRGELTNIDPGKDTRVVCHCRSCLRTMEHAGMADGCACGVDLYQTAPDHIDVQTGKALLVPKQFTEKGGVYRWHASCCNTPMFNTMKSPAFFFAGVLTINLTNKAPLGPAVVEAFVAGEDGKQRHKNLPTMLWRFMKREARARLTGRNRKNWFFGRDGKPVATPVQLPKR